jgi:toxin ParE1/3/4
MTQVVIAARVDRDLERVLVHLMAHDTLGPQQRIEDIISALDVLATNPWIGRPTEHGRRELVIGRDRHGYLALYAYDPRMDEVVILALRSQKESGYHHP